MNTHTIMRAHQYLYYVKCRPVLTDRQYDSFCKKHCLFGGGGSDRESDYTDDEKDMARKIKNGEVL